MPKSRYSIESQDSAPPILVTYQVQYAQRTQHGDFSSVRVRSFPTLPEAQEFAGNYEFHVLTRKTLQHLQHGPALRPEES